MRIPTRIPLSASLVFAVFLGSARSFDNITHHSNPLAADSDINSPRFLTFSAFEGRAFTFRIRLLGKK